MIKINKNFIFLGAPGAGKGTLAQEISKIWDIIHVSTGEIFRENVRNQTKLGLELKQIIEQGGYVDDKITNAIVANKLNDLAVEQKNFILDGYPRTLDQAQFLDNNNNKIDLVILLEASNEIILERLSNRRYCPTCQATYHLINKVSKLGDKCENDSTVLQQRKDDLPEAIVKRLKIYEEQTKPLIDFYKEKNILVSIAANGTINNLIDEFKKVILDEKVH